MLRFLVASHGLLSRTEGIELLEHGKLEGVHPLILGVVVDSEEGALLQPVNVGETLFTNRYRPPSPQTVDELEYQMVRLADGTRSVATIANAIGLRERSGQPRGESLSKCRRFFAMLILRGYGVAFTRPWRASAGEARGVSGEVGLD
jgi:hypothetical protein